METVLTCIAEVMTTVEVGRDAFADSLKIFEQRLVPERFKDRKEYYHLCSLRGILENVHNNLQKDYEALDALRTQVTKETSNLSSKG